MTDTKRAGLRRGATARERRSRLPALLSLGVALVALQAAGADVQADGSEAGCAQAALSKKPTIKHAYVVNPGRRPFEKHPHVVGPVQTTVISLGFPAIDPPEDENACAEQGVLRAARARLQKTVNGRWRYMATTWAFAQNTAGWMTGFHRDDGHGEADWQYLKPGEKERLVLRIEARDTQSGDTLASATQIIPVKVIRHRQAARAAQSPADAGRQRLNKFFNRREVRP